MNQKYVQFPATPASVPLIRNQSAVAFVQLRMVVVFVKMATVSFSPWPWLNGMNVNVDGIVMFTCVMFAIAPISVLLTVMLYTLYTFVVEVSLNENPNPFSYVDGVKTWAANVKLSRNSIPSEIM